MKNIIVWFFYLLGLFIFAEFIHELYHFYFCGGEFICGLGYIKEHVIIGGLTWCKRETFEGEAIPTIIELLIIVWGIFLKKR